MSEFYKTSTIWVVDFRYAGRPRRWFRAFGPATDVGALVAAELRDLYGGRAELVAARPAMPQEELAYLRGEVPSNPLCPTGRLP